MTVDVAAERDAAVARNEEATRETWLGMRASRLRREGEGLTIAAARALFPGLAPKRLQEVVDRAQADVQAEADRERVQVTVWTKDRMIKRGAELFREHPTSSAAEVYELLEKDASTVGARCTARSSWIGGYATIARRRAHEQNPDVLVGRQARAIGHRKRREQAKGQKAPKPGPKSGSSGRGRARGSERPEAEATPRTTPDTSAGSRPAARLLVEVGDSSLSAYAREIGDPWTVEYSGVVDGESLVAIFRGLVHVAERNLARRG